MTSPKRVVSVWTILIAGCSTVLAANSSTATCDLTCHANTTCVKGSANFSNHPTVSDAPLDFHLITSSPNGYHCNCTEGLTGLRCGLTYESCNKKKHICYNGGECIAGLEDEFGNEQLFCDCTNAKDENGTKYFGKYCEEQAPTQSCDGDGLVFCVNNATCKGDYVNHTQHPCQCVNGYEGPHCEFVKGTVPNCTLSCKHGGRCRLGIKSYDLARLYYSLYWDGDIDYQYCDCPDGYYGPQCEIISTPCDGGNCFNGATCVKKKLANSTMKEYCDCTTATKGDKSYAGQFCQYEETKSCKSINGQNGEAFCVNGGACANKGGILSCTCPEGFYGPICEFQKEDKGSHAYANCSLQCANNGECRNGAKDVSFLGTFGTGLENIANETANANFEHCVCQEGYVGITCEIKVTECGNGQHICLNGATCDKNEDKYTCNCDEATSGGHHFAGKFCQHKSTQICTTSGQPGTGANKFAFCVNNGTCKGKASNDHEHPGCNCTGNYEGSHCEFTKGSLEAQSTPATGATSSSSGSSKGTVVVTIVVLAVVGVMTAVVIFRVRRKSDVEPNEYENPGFGHTAGPVLDMGPEKDFDGNELENVEII